MKKTTTHGGSRKGSGRPPKPAGTKVVTGSICLPPALWEAIDRHRGAMSRSAFLTGILAEALTTGSSLKR